MNLRFISVFSSAVAMNRTLIITVSFVFVVSTLFLCGCHATGKKKTTDWSIPSVKLSPTSKNEKVAQPSERASAEATAQLAHERMDGHNPTATLRDSDDPSLQPNPVEIAKLHHFEGSNVPEWAAGSGLPPAPEASAPEPAERIAQNVTDSTMNAAAQTASARNVSRNADSDTNIYNGELPASLDEAPLQAAVPPAAPPPAYGTPHTQPAAAAAAPQLAASSGTVTPAGSTMTELPGTLPAPQTSAVPASSVVPASSSASAGASPSAQPAVFFMPGNINPQYPSGPAPFKP